MEHNWREALQIETKLRSKELEDKKLSIAVNEEYIRNLQTELHKLEEEYNQLVESSVEFRTRIDRAREAINMGEAANNLRNIILNDPELSPTTYREDLAVIDRTIALARATLSNLEPKLQQQIPQQISMKYQMDEMKTKVEQYSKRTASDHDWVSYVEPMTDRLNEIMTDVNSLVDDTKSVETTTAAVAAEAAVALPDNDTVDDNSNDNVV